MSNGHYGQNERRSRCYKVFSIKRIFLRFFRLVSSDVDGEGFWMGGRVPGSRGPMGLATWAASFTACTTGLAHRDVRHQLCILSC